MSGPAFTGEQEVVNYMESMMPFLAAIAFIDGCQGVLNGALPSLVIVPGVMRGCGLQHLGAYYVVGLPLAIPLAFYFHTRGRGLWIGLVAALVVQTAAYGAIAYFSDWKK